MANTDIVWNGSTALFLQEGYPLDVEDAGGLTRTLVYEGPYVQVTSAAPIIGALHDLGVGYIQTVTRNPLAGGRGRLTIICRVEYSGSTSDPSDNQQVYNIEWEEMDLPLSHNQLFRAAFYDSDGRARTIKIPEQIGIDGKPSGTQYGDIGVLNALIEQSISTNPKAYKAWDDWAVATFGNLSALFIDYVHRIWAGRDSFQFHAPVATITTRSIKLPKCNPCGRYMTGKPFLGCPDGYVWLRCDDRGTRTGKFGKWDRVIAWRGYEMIDKSLYKQA